MKITLLSIPGIKFKIFLHIEKAYFCKKIIIPIGCDCHPAYTLKKLGIRKFSLPFDWLNTQPFSGIWYVMDNIKNNFIFFLSGLTKNERGYIVAEKYNFAEFMHEKDLIENIKSQNKFNRRIIRFIKIINKFDCFFLYNLPSNNITNLDQIDKFVNDVSDFTKIIKPNDKLFIYFRYDENYDENREYCNTLLNKLNNVNKVHITKYIRSTKQFGEWGDYREYYSLYKNLGINLRLKFPNIYLKKSIS